MGCRLQFSYGWTHSMVAHRILVYCRQSHITLTDHNGRIFSLVFGLYRYTWSTIFVSRPRNILSVCKFLPFLFIIFKQVLHLHFSERLVQSFGKSIHYAPSFGINQIHNLIIMFRFITDKCHFFCWDWMWEWEWVERK